MANMKQRPDGTWEDDGAPIRATPTAAAPAPAAPVNMFPPAVDRETTTKSSNWSTTTHVPAAGAAKAQEKLDGSVEAQVEAERQSGIAKQAVEAQKAENATNAAVEADRNAAEIARKTGEAETRKASIGAAAEKQYQEYLTAKPESYWGNKSQGQKAAAWIGIALSGLGNALAGRGGQNEALGLLNADMDAHTNKEKERIQKMHEGYLKTAKDRDSVMDSLNTELGLLGLKSAATKEGTAKRAEAALLAKGGGVIDADAAKNIGVLRAAADKDKVEALAKLQTTKTNGGSSQKVSVDVDDAAAKAAAEAKAAKGAKPEELTSTQGEALKAADASGAAIETMIVARDPSAKDLEKIHANRTSMELWGDGRIGAVGSFFGMKPKNELVKVNQDVARGMKARVQVAGQISKVINGSSDADRVAGERAMVPQPGDPPAVLRGKDLTLIDGRRAMAAAAGPAGESIVATSLLHEKALLAKWKAAGLDVSEIQAERARLNETLGAYQASKRGKTPAAAGIEPPAVQSLTTTAPPSPPASNGGIPPGSIRGTVRGQRVWRTPDGKIIPAEVQ